MTDAIAWALVHFLWQGSVLALVAWSLMRLASSSSVRYAIGVATLAAMVVAVGLTAAMNRNAATEPQMVQGPTESTVQGSLADANLQTDAASVQGSKGPGVQRLPTVWILTLWIIGVVVLSTRALGGWWVARRVARDAVTPLSEELQTVARAVAHRLGIRRVVGVFESSRVSVPVMIGWLRPVVLMPPAALTGLSIAQVEAIVAHEFAHIRRHDYLVNLLQTAVETMLFFYPAVWWLSREIRRERELCCDDLAVSVSDRLTYATALSALAHLQPPSLALAATDGSLRDRVRRIITTSPSPESAKGGWMAIIPLLLVVSLAAPSAFTPTVAVAPKESIVPTVGVAAARPAAVDALITVLASLPPAPEARPVPVSPPASGQPFVVRPTLPVVINYFTVPTQAMELQAPPPLPQAPPAPRDSAITIQGRVARPGEKLLQLEHMTLSGAIKEAGGLLESAGDIQIRRRGVDQPINITRTQFQAGADLNLMHDDTVIVRQHVVFFVNGEIMKPGLFRWEQGMTVQKALDLAGGATSRGKLSHIERAVKDEKGQILKYQKIKKLKPETEILPDDQLFIAAKWFGE